RELGVIDIATSVVNITIGSGIFLLPGLVAAILGNPSIVAYIFCGLLYFCIMLCYAEMSSRITNSNGAYAYIEKAFGPFAGFIANNLYWFCGVLLGAALTNGGIITILSIYSGISLATPEVYRWLSPPDCCSHHFYDALVCRRSAGTYKIQIK
ncbi:MAG: amino acid permease, partial [Ginsengibacter sp.]